MTMLRLISAIMVTTLPSMPFAATTKSPFFTCLAGLSEFHFSINESPFQDTIFSALVSGVPAMSAPRLSSGELFFRTMVNSPSSCPGFCFSPAGARATAGLLAEVCGEVGAVCGLCGDALLAAAPFMAGGVWLPEDCRWTCCCSAMDCLETTRSITASLLPVGARRTASCFLIWAPVHCKSSPRAGWFVRCSRLALRFSVSISQVRVTLVGPSFLRGYAAVRPKACLHHVTMGWAWDGEMPSHV